MMKQLTLIFGMGIVALSPTQAAMDLASALSVKKVCERADGFIQATPGNEGEVAILVDQVNAKRSRVYTDIAAKDGLDPSSVGIAMAEQERAANPEKFCK
jgi:uncharacterized protein YdbL (DUF1318 family)